MVLTLRGPYGCVQTLPHNKSTRKYTQSLVNAMNTAAAVIKVVGVA